MISIVYKKSYLKTNYLLFLDILLSLMIFLFLINYYNDNKESQYFKTSFEQDYFETEEFFSGNTGVLPEKRFVQKISSQE